MSPSRRRLPSRSPRAVLRFVQWRMRRWRLFVTSPTAPSRASPSRLNVDALLPTHSCGSASPLPRQSCPGRRRRAGLAPFALPNHCPLQASRPWARPPGVAVCVEQPAPTSAAVATGGASAYNGPIDVRCMDFPSWLLRYLQYPSMRRHTNQLEFLGLKEARPWNFDVTHRDPQGEPK